MTDIGESNKNLLKLAKIKIIIFEKKILSCAICENVLTNKQIEFQNVLTGQNF